MVTDSDGGTLGHQHEGGRLADNFGMADHNDLHTLDLHAGGPDHLDRGCGGTWRQGHLVVDNVADRGRIHTLNILQRVNRRLQRAHIDMIRNRTLQNDPEHIRIIIHRDKTCLAFILCQVGGPVLLVKRQTNSGGGTRLSANIDGDFLYLADPDRDKAPNLATHCEPRDIRRHLVQNTLADIGAIEQPRITIHACLPSPGELAALYEAVLKKATDFWFRVGRRKRLQSPAYIQQTLGFTVHGLASITGAFYVA